MKSTVVSKKKVSGKNNNGLAYGKEPLPPVMYGLEGVCSLFNLGSKCVASQLIRSDLSEACAKKSNVIVIDVKKAQELHRKFIQRKLIEKSTEKYLYKSKLKPAPIDSSKALPPVVYGLEGLCKIFNLKTKGCASKWSRTILKDACTKKGNSISVDVKKAFTIFGCHKPENFVSD